MIQLKDSISSKSIDETWHKHECFWGVPPSELSVVNDEVHVWCIHLSVEHTQIHQMESILSDDELVKANRFHFAEHRRRYIASHSELRKIFGKYLNLDPCQIQFNYSSLGKPALVLNGGHPPLCFNLSHSNELALIAVTNNRSIGVDIEFMRPGQDLESIAKHYFSSQEYQIINSLSPDQRQHAFYDLWTLKEAYLKATGEGIGGLEHIEFSLSSYKTPKVISNKDNACTTGSWTVRQMIPYLGYTAGLAVEGNNNYIYRFYEN